MKIVFAIMAVLTLLVFSHPTAIAQPAGSLLSIWNAGGDGSGSGDWNTAANWNPSSVPNVTVEDSAVINGGGTATVSGASPTAGGIVLGQNAGESGTLSVTGGSITFAEDLTFPADGSVRVGQGGTGMLQITGGSLTSTSLSSAGDAGSLIRLSGTSTLSTGSASLGRTTGIVGPNVNFSTSSFLAMTGTHDLIAEITGSTHSTIDVGTVATLGGTLSVEFNGYVPLATDTWDLINATTVNGAFSAINVTGAEFGSGQALNVRAVPSGGDTLLQLFLEQQLVLNVNRATGVLSITNPGAVGIDFDGYSIRSESGALEQANWNSLASQLGSGWTEANPSATGLHELIGGSNATAVAGSGSLSLGAVYDPAPPTEFDTETDDLVFQYTVPGAGNISATVEYTGPGVINDLVLYVDPSTGATTLRNTSPFNVSIDAYTIISDSGSLDEVAWSSLDDQNAEAGTWEEANPSSTRVSELMNGGETAMSIHRSFGLGWLFDTAGEEDLVFEYLLAGENTARTGVVVYEAAPAQIALPGDYNNNGTVDAADYTVWRDALGTMTTSPAPPPPPPAPPMDYLVWVNNFGESSGTSSAVPEPAAICQLLLAGLVAFGRIGVRTRN